MFAFIFLRLFLAVRAGTDRGAAMLKPVVNVSAGSQRSSLAGLEARPEAALSLWLFIRSGVRATPRGRKFNALVVKEVALG